MATPTIDGRRGSLKLCYLTELAPDRLLAAAMWVDREAHPGKPLFNAATDGCLPMAILLAESVDGGQSWSDWRLVPMDEALGPPSLTAPVLKLADGSLAMSIETNKHYDDTGPWRQCAVFLWSQDNGRTWSDPQPVAQDPAGIVFNWDLRCAVAPDGRVVSFAWTYDTARGTYDDIHRRVAADGGRTWTPPEALGFADQAGMPAILTDGRMVLPWVDRFGSHTIRARSAASADAPFDPDSECVLYDHAHHAPDKQGHTGELLADMETWSFGLPYAVPLPDGSVLVAYYGGTADVMDVFWSRLRP